MTLTVELLLSLLASVGAGLGAYAAIRSDLARLHERASHAMAAATRAHERIDNLKEARG